MDQAIVSMKSLIDNKQPVEQVADYFVQNYGCFVYELSKIIDRQFHEGNSEKKSLCISLICQILKRSLETEWCRYFVKGLGQRLKYMLHEISRNYVSQGVALQIDRNIDSLRLKGIFCDEFFEKLQILAKRIKDNSSGQQQIGLQKSNSFQEGSKKYSRTFLLSLQDIFKQPQLKQIYWTYTQYTSAMRDILRQKTAKQTDPDESFRAGSQDSQASKKEVRSQEIDLLKERFEKVILSCHSHIKGLKESMNEELIKYEESIMSSNYKIDSQYEIIQE